MTEFSLSTMVVSENGDRLYTFEYAALVTETSTMIIEQFVQVGLIEPIGSMLHAREIARIGQIQRLRQDLGLNLVGAVMVVDMAQEIAQLRARLKALES
ncbi:chaperone modulator CbpM [Lyngbya sp. CCAP 1446/10]|uniref:chaperone modulator CbpM n=1 Tax=Lyngbya sp. CCAP 1446/10 TaxID=439293 RepID=UPI002237E1D1|nr:chaperone modulator CbpM [Lyngbya sp. CCAP 1446/10]MCW6053820.1 chaperone modulator CbpM [Lyngbya sp. CCAP 1446/10]